MENDSEFTSSRGVQRRDMAFRMSPVTLAFRGAEYFNPHEDEYPKIGKQTPPGKGFRAHGDIGSGFGSKTKAQKSSYSAWTGLGGARQVVSLDL